MSKTRRYCLIMMFLSVVPIGVYVWIYSETMKIMAHNARGLQDNQYSTVRKRMWALALVYFESDHQTHNRITDTHTQSKRRDATSQTDINSRGDANTNVKDKHTSKPPNTSKRLNVTQQKPSQNITAKSHNVNPQTRTNTPNVKQKTDTERHDVKVQTSGAKRPEDTPPTNGTDMTKSNNGRYVKSNSNEKGHFVKPHTSTGKPLEFTVSDDGRLFILGAARINSKRRLGDRSVRGKINVYGQRFPDEKRLLCFLKYSDGTTSQVPVKTDHRFYVTGGVPLPVFNVICPDPIDRQPDEWTQPVGVSVTFAGSDRKRPQTGYVKPHLPQRQAKTTLAITTKISHGNLSADLVITWMEAYLWLGVDKVITYALSSLSSDARAVMEYYSKKGVLDLYEYKIPAQEQFRRSIHVQSMQTWTDAALPMFDAFARSSGYTYFSVVDWDEFIIPSGNRTLKQLMERLFARSSQQVAGFRFKSQFFKTSASSGKNKIVLKKFVPRLNASPKIIFKPEFARVDKSHDIEPYSGYMLLDCPKSEANVRHFRNCLPADVGGVGACTKASEQNLVRDAETSALANNIADNVRRAKAEIFH